ncbi:MAG: alkaline phosphatase [Planctomycetaceae bacterium]|nr:alkaline phosphatase [Planctomycetaceae bacterium]
MRYLIRLCILFSVAVSVAVSSLTAAEVQPVKYVFLFIGDGMSLPQRQIAEEYMQKTKQHGLKINAMPFQSLTTTHSADNYVTDSAASGTAIACGTKTNNGCLGLDPKGKRLESVAEAAHKNGRKVGIITSVTINHATPAAFYARSVSRNNYYEIGLDLIASGFDYFGGGGIADHDDKKSEKYKGDLYELAKKAGYTVARTEAEIAAVTKGSGKVIAAGNKDALPYAIDEPSGGLRLADFTRQAIELLDNPAGFFIMVEGGKIDWACHDNDAATAVHEVIEFDNAVSAAFQFAEKHPKDTLILVTADHETGGLSVGNVTKQNTVFIQLLKAQKASVGELAKLAGMSNKEMTETDEQRSERSRRFVTENTGLLFTEEGKWSPGNLHLTKEEMKLIQDVFTKPGKDIAKTLVKILNKKAGLFWTSGNHSSLPVNTSLWGNQAGTIADNIRDNTDIAKQLKQAVQPVTKSRVVPQTAEPKAAELPVRPRYERKMQRQERKIQARTRGYFSPFCYC